MIHRFRLWRRKIWKNNSDSLTVNSFSMKQKIRGFRVNGSQNKILMAANVNKLYKVSRSYSVKKNKSKEVNRFYHV